MPSIDEIYGTVAPPRSYRTPEVVTPSPAVPANALVLFQEDPAGLRDMALSALSVKLKPVETQEAYNFLAERLAQAETLLKNIETRRKMVVEPIKRSAKAVDLEAAKWSDPVEAWTKEARTKLLAFQKLDADRKRREDEARQKAIRDAAIKQNEAEIMGNTEAADAASVEIMKVEAEAPAQAVAGFKGDSGTISTRKTWEVEVVDLTQLPDAYWMVDLPKIKAAVKAGARTIEGCHIYEQDALTVRTR